MISNEESVFDYDMISHTTEPLSSSSSSSSQQQQQSAAMASSNEETSASSFYRRQLPPVDYFMTNDRLNRDHANDNIFLVDLQFTDGQLAEIAMICPMLPIIYHRSYNTRNIHNRKTYRHNLTYTGRHRNFICDKDLFNDDYIFKNIWSGSIVILRGRDKLYEMRSKIDSRKDVKYFTFPEKLMPGKDVCSIHADVSMCAVKNVIQMAKYYNLYSSYYNNDI